MAVPLREYPLKDMNNFEKVCGHLVNYIRKTWNWQGMTPRDWEHRDGEKEQKQAQKDREKEAQEEFKGPDTGTAGAYSAEERLSRYHVNFDLDHGRDPLHTLVSSCIAYGMIVEQERQRRIHIFNVDEQARNFKNRCLPAMAETYVPEEKRQEFLDQMYQSFEFYTRMYGKSEEFRYAHSCYDVAKWEGNLEGFIADEERRYEEVSILVDELIQKKKDGEL